MIRRYLITLVGSEEPNGSRTITTEGDADTGPILFAVGHTDLKDYVPNPGDALIRYADGRIWFEPQS